MQLTEECDGRLRRPRPAGRGAPKLYTHLIDALVFNSPSPRWRDVMVAGQWRLQGGHHPLLDALAQAHEGAMRQVWA
jgi:hypothetical protein